MNFTNHRKTPKWLANTFIVAVLGLLLINTTACNQVQQMISGTPTFTPTNTPTSTVTPTPEPTATPTLTPTPAPLTSSEIFDQLSPAVVFVDTPAFTGSGILIDNGYILTNYHVVWPFEKVRVVFPDGSEHLDVPVLNWDPMGDMAVIGPIDTDIPPLKLVSGEELAIGSEVYLIGYPGEVENFPQATITRGLISRMREWSPNGVTYFQTDAMIGGGQSGGILVSELGEVIGISNFTFSDAGFGLVASASDILPRIEQLIAGEDVSGLGERKIPLTGGAESYPHINLEHEFDSQVFIINEPAGTKVKIEAQSEKDDIAFTVRNVVGAMPTYADNTTAGIETTEFTAEYDAPYFVNVFQYTFWSPSFKIEASKDMSRYVDIDDGKGSPYGQTVIGNMDYPGDTDYFRLVLDKGDVVNILVDSILIDPLVAVVRPGDKPEQYVSDDDTGGGIFGLNAELTFAAPESDTYLVIVQDSQGHNIGGYSLEVRDVYDEAPTPIAPEPTPTALASKFGEMNVYESIYGPFSIQYPATWTDDRAVLGQMEAFCRMASACFAGDSLLAIVEEDLSTFGEPTLEEYTDFYINTLDRMGFEVALRQDFTTTQGLTGEILTFDFGGLFKATRFIYVHNNIGFNATVIGPNEEDEELIEYIFSTFEVTGK